MFEGMIIICPRCYNTASTRLICFDQVERESGKDYWKCYQTYSFSFSFLQAFYVTGIDCHETVKMK